MDFTIGDIVRHSQRGVGVVQLIDGIAVWVRWSQGQIDHTSSFELEVLDKAA